MEPADALATCERALRQLMEPVYSKKYGSDWLTRFIDDEKLAGWQRRWDSESRTRGTRGVAQVDRLGLAYAEFTDLYKIAMKDWEPLAPALGKKDENKILLERFAGLRNPVAHSRELLPFEAELLSGIAGLVRNRVTIFMSSQDVSGMYYPRIESVVDSFGNEPNNYLNNRAWILKDTGLVLRVGDVVTFRCRAVDPQGRPLQWSIRSPRKLELVCQMVGDDVTLEWRVGDDAVGQQVRLELKMTALETNYHRWVTHDGGIFFGYQVLPPAGEAFQ